MYRPATLLFSPAPSIYGGIDEIKRNIADAHRKLGQYPEAIIAVANAGRLAIARSHGAGFVGDDEGPSRSAMSNP